MTMKILYHHRTLGDGAEGIHIREMITAFRRLGHEVRVVALSGETGNGSSSGKQRRWKWVSRMLPAHAYELAELGYNVVGRRRLVRAIHQFRPDFIYDRYNCYCTAAVDAGRQAGVPVILEVNAPVAYERTAYENLKLKFPVLAERFEQRVCSQADHVFVVSTPLRDFLVEKRAVSPSKITVLPNGANPEDFDPTIDGSTIRRQLGVGDGTLIGFVGILRPWHGLEILLSAFARLRTQHRNAHLVLVGDGPLEQKLKARADQLGLAENVTFIGRVAHHDVRHYVAAMDIAVSPRATFYASPMKILEYMAMGVPTVAPDMPNIRDILRHGLEGLLFEAEHEESLKCAIDTIVSNPVLAEELGRNARRKIETQLNWTNNALKVIDTATQTSTKDPH